MGHIQWTCEPDRCVPNDCQPDCQPNCNPNCSPGCYPTTCTPVKNAVLPVNAGSDCRPVPVGTPSLRTVWFELTGKCQLNCVHCYAESSPKGTHGTMTVEDWLRLVDETNELGVRMIQLIGGEPTLYPGWVSIVDYAISLGIEVEVYSNLVSVKPDWWKVFERRRVSLATSYYSVDPQSHNAITGARSHARTLAHIQEALKRGIPIRVGVIGMHDDQAIEATMQQLGELGVKNVGLDHLRQVGRGVRDQTPSTAQLCGKCGNQKCAISPTGQVWPCVFSRWDSTTIGNVQDLPLAQILKGTTAVAVNAQLQQVFAARRQEEFCRPDCSPDCHPTIMCNPNCTPQCNPGCNPNCTPNCNPSKPNMVLMGSGHADDPTFCEPDNDCSPDQNCNPNQQCNPDCNPGKDCTPQCNPGGHTLMLAGVATGASGDCTPQCNPGGNGCNPDCDPSHHCSPDDQDCTPTNK